MTKLLVSAFLTTVILFNSILACGPGWVSPVFDNERAPESPYREFAAGNLGIVKPSYRRMVLIAAFRYLTGGGFSEPEQKALIEFWEAEINNRSIDDTDAMSVAVKAWIEQRKPVAGADAKVPEIYVERSWGGYEFFPNCTRNAFETATRTLADRVMSHGSDDRHVKSWLKAQDQVFNNCANGRSIPEEPNAEMAEWLRKDRAYQIAAAEFYSLNYENARKRFTEIAQDTNSPWQETSEYLIGRTLIRQASLVGDRLKSESLYLEADQALQLVTSKGGRFADDAERLLGIVKYRLRPADRMHELAQTVSYQGSANFRQDLIDYSWLLDKYEKETLESEERRKTEEAVRAGTVEPAAPAETPIPPDPGKLTLYLYADDQSYNFDVPAESSDAEAIAVAERTIGKPLTKEQRESIVAQRQSAYASRFNDYRDSGYQGGYWGNEAMSVSLLPEAIRQDEISEWLFIYQMRSADAYPYALAKFRQSEADIWLMTALSKADPASQDLDMLIDKAQRIPMTSPAFATISYDLARIEIARGKVKDARALLDNLINSPVAFPVSTRNQFLKLRMGLSETLDDFLTYAQRKPYAFDFDGRISSLDEHIKDRKSWWSAESYPDQTKEQFDKSIDDEFRQYRDFEKEPAFDSDSLAILNRYFPTEQLLTAERSDKLPPKMRTRLAISVWTRAVLLDDDVLARAATPRLLANLPELADDLKPFQAATTPSARKRAAFFAILKNPILSPVVEIGIGTDNSFEEWDDDNWWCGWFFDSENEDPATLPVAPTFLSTAQKAAAKTERSKLAAIGDAPKYFASQTLEWARIAPADKRVPEALYIAWSSNSWTKYGCGNGPEIQEEIAAFMRKRYPASDWTKKLDEANTEQ